MKDIALHRALDTVSERLEELQIFFLVPGRRLLAHKDRHSHLIDEAKSLCFRHLVLGFCLCLGFFLLQKSTVIDFFSKETVVRALHDLYESLSARVNYSRLLEDRQQLRGVCEDLLGLFQDSSEEELEILFSRICQLSRFESGTLGNGQNGPFLGLHDRLIGCLDSSVKGFRKYRDREDCLRFRHLAESADQLRENDAGVSSCASQRTGGHRLTDILHAVQVSQCRDFIHGRFDRESHIRAGIAVGHRKYIQFVDPLFISFQIGCTGKKHFCQEPCIYCAGRHRIFLLQITIICSNTCSVDDAHAFYINIDLFNLKAGEIFHPV